ncbi:hypothetical protein LguiA_013031 [Lonicera macranthoides]
MHIDTSVKCNSSQVFLRHASSINSVSGAAWDPDGCMMLIAFSESSTLASIHFASKPPSLDAHLLPVDLPEIQSLTGC